MNLKRPSSVAYIVILHCALSFVYGMRLIQEMYLLPAL